MRLRSGRGSIPSPASFLSPIHRPRGPPLQIPRARSAIRLSASPITTWSALSSGRRYAAGNRSAHDCLPTCAPGNGPTIADERLAWMCMPLDKSHIGPVHLAVAESLDVGVHQPASASFSGNSAATVIRPSAGCAARLPTKDPSAYLKLQQSRGIGINQERIQLRLRMESGCASKNRRFRPCVQVGSKRGHAQLLQSRIHFLQPVATNPKRAIVPRAGGSPDSDQSIVILVGKRPRSWSLIAMAGC